MPCKTTAWWRQGESRAGLVQLRVESYSTSLWNKDASTKDQQLFYFQSQSRFPTIPSFLLQFIYYQVHVPRHRHLLTILTICSKGCAYRDVMPMGAVHSWCFLWMCLQIAGWCSNLYMQAWLMHLQAVSNKQINKMVTTGRSGMEDVGKNNLFKC